MSPIDRTPRADVPEGASALFIFRGISSWGHVRVGCVPDQLISLERQKADVPEGAFAYFVQEAKAAFWNSTVEI